MPEGGLLRLSARNVQIEDSLAAQTAVRPGACLELIVEDTGPAIPAGLRERVFEPFFHAPQRTADAGLRLAAALGIAKSHGGTIELENHPAGGVAFHIFLPAEERSERLVPISETQEVAALLLLEQDPGLRDILKRALTRAGFTVWAAAHGTEAVSLLTQHKGAIRLVLTELGTGEIDLATLTRLARDLNPNVRIVASSAYGTSLGQADKITALKTLGIHRLLPKPCSLAELLDAIRAELVDPAVPASSTCDESRPGHG